MIQDTLANAAKQFLATAETWRQDELDLKRRTLAELEYELRAAQEKTRTLPATIGNLRATIARLEAQTDVDLARRALEPARQAEEQPTMSCPSCRREYPDFDGAGDSARLAQFLAERNLSPDCPQPVHQERSDGPSKRERL